MKKHLLLFLALSAFAVQAQTFNAGIRIQKTHEAYWENGISLQYSFANFKPKQFYVGFDYVTSRLGSAMNSNAIAQDNFLFSASWLGNKEKNLHFVSRVNVGYFTSDLGEPMFDELPNTAILLSPEIGLNYIFENLPININLGTGYYIDLLEEGYSPGTFQPLYYHLDLTYSIIKK